MQRLEDAISGPPIWLYRIKLSWIDIKVEDINRFKVIVLFRDYEPDEQFSAIPKILSTLNQNETYVLSVKAQGEVYQWQLFEVNPGKDMHGNPIF